MSGTKFVYVTYIRSDMQKVFDALRLPEFTRRYWMGTTQQVSEWKKGAAWAIHVPDGRKFDDGEVLEIDPPRKLVLTWRHLNNPALTAEGFSRLTYELEPQGSLVKLTLTHQIDVENSKLIEAVSGGWPGVMAGLKTLLETGVPIDEFTKWPVGV